MATQDLRTIVRTSQRLWSEEVARANAQAPLPPFDPSYEFTNGRKFIEKSPFYVRLPEPPAE